MKSRIAAPLRGDHLLVIRKLIPRDPVNTCEPPDNAEDEIFADCGGVIGIIEEKVSDNTHNSFINLKLEFPACRNRY